MLHLDSGEAIEVIGRPPQGTRHRIVLGHDHRSGRDVVVKIEVVPGALENERRALEWLTLHGGPAPRLRSASRVRIDEGEDKPCPGLL